VFVKRYKRWLAKSIYRGILALVITGSFGLSAMAQTVTVGGGLDCNGWSPISHNVKPMICTDPHGPEGGRFYDNGWYIGHDEPDVQFYSSKPGSGNNMVWHFTLPKHDPVPTQSGTSVATFELTPAIWFSLALCDPNSYPQNPCIPDSDRNTGTGLTTDAGNAALELQFYPPGWPPFVTQISCDQTRWCAALTIDSLECNYNFAYCNPNCEEPVNFAFIQDNGVPAGPPAPGQQTLGSFTPNSQTLLMNPGDDIVAIIRDTPQGLLTRVIDLTTGQSGFMVAGAKNGFANTDLTSCKTTSFNFHPEFSTAKTQNVATWTALQANVNFAVETGHFELGASGDGDVDDAPCFPGPTIAGCLALAIGGDLDFDGPPYLPDWPDGSTNHPSTVLMRAFNDRGVGPMTFGSNENDWGHPVGYPKLQFKTDVALSDPGCNSVTGAGCVVPPNGAAFYPFFTQLGKDKDTCSFAFGSDIPGESTNDFGKDAQYGPFITENTVVYGNAGKVMPNPCNPAGIPGLN
jgi:hypothetical protein